MKHLLLLLPGLLAVQDNDNPEYKRWASFSAGSWVKLKSEIETKGNKMALPLETTRTLLEVDEKKVVVEEVVTNTLANKKEESKKRTYQAKAKKKESVEKEGDEELEAGGKKLSCHWTETKEAAGTVKTWTNADVPGGIVKTEITTNSPAGVTRLTAIAWEKK